MKDKWKDYSVCIIAALIFVIMASVVRYRPGNINYYNSDATWHTLLTIEAYNRTPVSEHLFLPLVTLGYDKEISWGMTIPNEEGNFFYTSFSPAGYFLPWLFFKLFHLPVCEQSLYVFNTLLFAVSAMLWAVFLKWIFKKNYVVILGTMLYIFSPELLHGMGIVYWHQSILQVTLIAQIMAYYQYKRSGNKWARLIFYLITFINPYIEWTGYVANGGFVLAELLEIKREKVSVILRRVICIGMLTIGSFMLFVRHYLFRLNEKVLFYALEERFFARSVTIPAELSDVFGGYFKSFAYIWIVLLVLIVWNVWKHKKIEVSHGMLMMLLAFPLLENVIMKQHAITYSYDRMKGIFFLSFLCCELITQISADYKKNKGAYIALVLTVVMAGFFNVQLYRNSDTYVWEAEYREDNRILADYINEKYDYFILSLEGAAVRGYMNLLFDSGIYEWADFEALKEVAARKERNYIITIHLEDIESWNMYDLSGATVYDVRDGSTTELVISNGKILEEAL